MDGHQHVHLATIVLNVILELTPEQGIGWLRSTAEPWPIGLSWRYWQVALTQGGWLKWLVLQLLSRRAQPAIRRYSLASNQGFTGVPPVRCQENHSMQPGTSAAGRQSHDA